MCDSRAACETLKFACSVHSFIDASCRLFSMKWNDLATLHIIRVAGTSSPAQIDTVLVPFLVFIRVLYSYLSGACNLYIHAENRKI